MQSETTEVSQNTLPRPQSANSLDSSQYGQRSPDEPVSSAPACEGDGNFNYPADEVDSSSGLSSAASPNSSLQRLGSKRRGKSTPSVDRISEYEGAAIGSSRKPEVFGFKIIPSSGGGSNGHSIEDFPNEVLTHILSHLPPSSLSSVSLVSHRFYSLVTTPHAWRIAFSRYFPGPAGLKLEGRKDDATEFEYLASQRRAFSRLTALASWRSEYILRTRLLRSLARGRPAEYHSPVKHGSSRLTIVRNPTAVFTYTSQLMYPVSHIDGMFGAGLSKKQPIFIHGAADHGLASTSDPTSRKVGSWGISDHQVFKHFAELFPGEAEWGLGAGNVVGMPNTMDLSQAYGMVYGEGAPQGRVYFISSNERRGRFLSVADASSQPPIGIPGINMITTSICSVWIAKSPQILKMTNGICGILSGSSSGILTAYALGPNPSYVKRFERGEVTAKWVLSPGVPIIAIKVDDNYSAKRHSQRRIWAAVLNALGEVFYITEIPIQSKDGPKSNPAELDQMAWRTGRTVRWEMVEPTKRVARQEPFNRPTADCRYSPRSSCNSMGLDWNQIAAETRDVEKFLAFKPKHFRKFCLNWDMRQKLEVDFAGDDYHNAGESVVVIGCGFDDSHATSIRRFTRQKLESDIQSVPCESSPEMPTSTDPPSIFGDVAPVSVPCSVSPSGGTSASRNSSYHSQAHSYSTVDEWLVSEFVFDDQRSVVVTVSALDISTFSQVTTSEDPLLVMYGRSDTSCQTSSLAEVPGQRARYMAVGTSTGVVVVWDIRAAVPGMSEVINYISPIRIIHTDSPEISCLALTSLYLVHGGNDGLVQAWDPLASSMLPVRTLNSRFSARARRRLVQAQSSVQGVGINYFAAGAVCLDPDPTVLRGVVSLGTQLRYWAYNSSAADQYKGNKRRLRYSQRRDNDSLESLHFTSTGRGALKEYIANEKLELERQKAAKQKERELLSGRFGIDLLGPDASEDDLLAYAQMLSEESYAIDERIRRGSGSSNSANSSGDIVAPNDISLPIQYLSSSSSPTLDDVGEEPDSDIAAAVRLSLPEESASLVSSNSSSLVAMISSSVPIKHSKLVPPSLSSPAFIERSNRSIVDVLEFAPRLRIETEQSLDARTAFSLEGEFPALGSAPGFPPGSTIREKGKLKE